MFHRREKVKVIQVWNKMMTEISFWLKYPFKDTHNQLNKTLMCKNILQQTGAGVLSWLCHDSAALTVMQLVLSFSVEKTKSEQELTRGVC